MQETRAGRSENSRLFVLCVLIFWSFSLVQVAAAFKDDNVDKRAYLFNTDDRHTLLQQNNLFSRLSQPPMKRRLSDAQNNGIIDLNEVGDLKLGAKSKSVRMHNLFGRTIPIRSEEAPFATKIFRIGGHQYPLFNKARSFNDNSNYRDAMKRILLRMN